MTTNLLDGCVFIYQSTKHPTIWPGEKETVDKLVAIAHVDKIAEVDTACAAKNLALRLRGIHDITFFYTRSAPIRVFSGKDKIVL